MKKILVRLRKATRHGWFRLAFPVLLSLGLGIFLTGTILLTFSQWQWTAFLSGILLAALLALSSLASGAEWRNMRRSAQLNQTRARLMEERSRREGLEKILAGMQARLDWLGRIPAVVIVVDREGRCRYASDAFRRFLIPGVAPEGRLLEEVFASDDVGRPIREGLSRALGGEMLGGILPLHGDKRGCQWWGCFLPGQDGQGQLHGYGILAEVECLTLPNSPVTGAVDGAGLKPLTDPRTRLYVEAITEDLSGWQNPRERLTTAFSNDEFLLYGQSIRVLGVAALPSLVEVLIRLKEEEDSLEPPGAFIPLLEQYNLTALLDRWVVTRVFRLLRLHGKRGQALPICGINLCASSLADAEFPRFVSREAESMGLSAANLCFEMGVRDCLAQPKAAARAIAALGEMGSGTILCGFGEEWTPFDTIKELHTSHIKIDGSLILGMLRSPAALSKIRAIHRVAQTLGIRTIAEFVEDDAILNALKEIGVDYVQGFGVALPAPLEGLLESSA